MTVTTRDGTGYVLEYRDLDGSGKRLAICRMGGPDDTRDGRPMVVQHWYRVSVLTPMPPELGSRMHMILDPQEDVPPVVRTSAMVVAVVGLVD